MINLVSEDSPILKQVAPEYDFGNTPDFLSKDKSFGLKEFIDSMFVVLHINKGVGLAAPQIGHSLRLFIMKIGVEEFICINPIIKEQTIELSLDQEGCLSFPQLTLLVKRSDKIFVSYQNINGAIIQRWFTGLAARCFQHELDHLNGITFDTKVANLSLKMAKQRRRKLLKQAQRKK